MKKLMSKLGALPRKIFKNKKAIAAVLTIILMIVVTAMYFAMANDPQEVEASSPASEEIVETTTKAEVVETTSAKVEEVVETTTEQAPQEPTTVTVYKTVYKTVEVPVQQSKASKPKIVEKTTVSKPEPTKAKVKKPVTEPTTKQPTTQPTTEPTTKEPTTKAPKMVSRKGWCLCTSNYKYVGWFDSNQEAMESALDGQMVIQMDVEYDMNTTSFEEAVQSDLDMFS